MNPDIIKQAVAPAAGASLASNKNLMALLSKMLPMILGGANGANSDPVAQQEAYSVGNMQAPTQPRYDYGEAVKKALLMKGY